MGIIERYIFRQTSIAIVFITLVLTALVFLTQSLRFLDMVINAGASGFFIWLQTLLYLPGFFEIILPIGVIAAALFTYNRLTMDSELIVLRSLGFSPLRLAKPTLLLGCFLGFLLFIIMGWIAPSSRSEAITLRQEIKAQMSSLIFREGIFNEAGKNVMVYIRDRDSSGHLHGLIIHDSRDQTKPPITVIARNGVLVSTQTGQQVLVYNGSRQDVDPKTGILRRLDFEKYTIDMPEKEISQGVRWQEPEERNNFELIKAINDKKSETAQARRELRSELQKRILIPFLVPGFALIALSLLLIGSHDRRGQGKRVIIAIAAVIVLEVLFLSGYNISKQSPTGFPLMLMAVILPYLLATILFFKEWLVKEKEQKA